MEISEEIKVGHCTKQQRQKNEPNNCKMLGKEKDRENIKIAFSQISKWEIKKTGHFNGNKL